MERTSPGKVDTTDHGPLPIHSFQDAQGCIGGIIPGKHRLRIRESRSMKRRTWLLGTGMATWLPLARADLYDDYINSVSKQPFVAFLGRGGFPGHAFVGIGVQLNAGLRVYERFMGYYPVGGDKVSEVKLVLGKASGMLDYQWKDTSWTQEYRVNVDPVEHAAAIAVADTWRSNDPKYNLFASGGKNCSSFAGEVAKAVGLKAPSGAGLMLPVAFIIKLREANGG